MKIRGWLVCLFFLQALGGCTSRAVVPPPSQAATRSLAVETPALPPTTTPSLPAAMPGPTGDPGVITPKNAARLVELRQLGLGYQTGTPLFTPDGRWLLLPASTGVYRYDTANYQAPQRILNVPAREPASLSPDGQTLAIGSRLFDIRGDEARELSAEAPDVPAALKRNGPAQVARFSPDGQSLGLVYYDQQLGVFSRSDGRLMYTLAGKWFDYSPDGRYLFTQETRDDIQHVCLYEAATGKLLRDWTAERAHFVTGDQLAVESAGAVRLYDLSTGKAVQALDGRFAAFSPDGQVAAVIVMQELRLVRVADRGLLARIQIDLSAIDDASLKYSPDGKTLAAVTTDLSCCGGYDARLALYSVPEGRVILRSKGGPQVFSPDGQTIITSETAYEFQVRSTRDGAVNASLGGLTAPVTGLVFLGDGQQLVAATYGDSPSPLLFYQVENGELLRQIPTNINAYDYGLAASPDGRLVALAGEIWETGNLKALSGLTHKMVEHSHLAAHGLAFSPDGTRVATGLLGGNLQIWDIPGERLVTEKIVCEETVFSLAYSPDGERLALACA
ncbi:MAG: hypothetical protein EHM21_13360, partial [Chloroflexi bacterium]